MHLHIVDSEKARTVNESLAEAILALPEDKYDRKSHFFNGRYENRYIGTSAHPSLQLIIDQALMEASKHLHLPKESLQVGFWLNIMHKGDITTLHSHDDDDELLSAVYYVQVPACSGLFKLHHQGRVNELLPIAGRFMFFDPALPHEVSEHQSEIPRISIGINFGTKQQRI